MLNMINFIIFATLSLSFNSSKSIDIHLRRENREKKSIFVNGALLNIKKFMISYAKRKHWSFIFQDRRKEKEKVGMRKLFLN